MSGKRPSLAESMKQAATAEIEPTAAPPVPIKAPQPSVVVEPLTKRPEGFYAATRAGKKKVTATLTPSAHKQLKVLTAELDATTEALLAEAINDLFRKHGKKPIA